MRKAVEEHLESRGRHVVRPPADPTPVTLESLVDGFLVRVLRLDPESYRRAFWREAYRGGHTIGHVPRTLEGFFRRNARTFEQRVSLLLAVSALFGAYAVATLLYGRLSLVVRRLRRPAYYARERERRRRLAAERREVRRHRTLNPRPTFDAIRSALRAARGSPEGALRLGSLLEDLECFVDNSLRFGAGGRIAGRRGGVKRLLQREAPDLFAKYSTLMRYKAMARRFRQACGSGEPAPAATLLPAPAGGAGGPLAGLARAREVAREILGECEGTLISLEAALALRLDPDCVPARGDAYARRPGRPRIPKRAVGWLFRRRVA